MLHLKGDRPDMEEWFRNVKVIVYIPHPQHINPKNGLRQRID